MIYLLRIPKANDCRLIKNGFSNRTSVTGESRPMQCRKDMRTGFKH